MDRIDTIINSITRSIEIDEEEKSNWFQHIDQVIEEIYRYHKVHTYSYISKRIKEYYTTINKECQIDAFQKLLLLQFIKKAQGRISKNCDLTPNIIDCYHEAFEKFMTKIENNRFAEEFYRFDDNRYLKVQSVCALHSLPLNPFIIDRDRLSLRFLFSSGLKQFFAGLNLVLFRMKGVSPVYKIHTNQLDLDAMKHFNRNGWTNMFMNLAVLLEEVKDIKAVCGTSWFLDPELINVSPELSYINSLMHDMNAFIFGFRTDKQSVKNALFMNPKRQKLFNEGSYIPRKHLIVILRKDLLIWKANQAEFTLAESNQHN